MKHGYFCKLRATGETKYRKFSASDLRLGKGREKRIMFFSFFLIFIFQFFSLCVLTIRYKTD